MKMFLLFLLAAALQYGSGTPVLDPMCEHAGEERDACQAFQMSLSEDKIFSKTMQTTGPNAEALTKYCPHIKNYLNCSKSYSEICHQTTYSHVSRVYDIVLELCDVQSRLHQAYIRNFDCVFGLKDQIKSCEGPAENQKSLYQKHYGYDNEASNEEFNYEGDHESQCLFGYLMTACFFTMAEKTCGTEARDTFFEIVMRASDSCSDLAFDDLERKYLTAMDIADPESPDNRLKMFRNRTEEA